MRAFVLLAGFLAVAAAACADPSEVNNVCPSVQSTGGDPTGDWTITASCQIPYARTTSADWCSQLVYDEQAVHDGLFLGAEFLPLQSGSINYKPDDPMAPTKCGTPPCGTYEATFVFAGMTTTHFPRGCLSQHLATADGNCLDLEAKMSTLANSVLPTIQNVMCTDEPDGSGGCACSYLVTTATLTTELGAWRVRDGLLIHYPATLAQAGVTDIAIDGNEMLLHGHNGMPLLAHDPLHFLQLTRSPPKP